MESGCHHHVTCRYMYNRVDRCLSQSCSAFDATLMTLAVFEPFLIGMILAKLWLIFGPDVEIAMFQELEAPESVPREEDTSAGSLEEQLQQQKNQKDWGDWGEGGCTTF